MFTVVSSFLLLLQPEQAATPTLHTSGHYILDSANNVVYLRGIGRTGDLQSASGMWSAPGMALANWGQKWLSIEENIPMMDATLQCYRDYWHVNMIRILIPVNWWYQDTVNSTDFQPDAPQITISYRDYIETLAQEASKYDIYLDFCPYALVDTYQFSGQWEGEPNTGWVADTGSAYFMNQVTTQAGRTEMQFWEQWWTSVVQRLGVYPNVILEMWNEPGDNQDRYFGYVVDMYRTIRGLGCQNLIFNQWNPGLIPTANELDWVPKLYTQLTIAEGGSKPTNVAFTTHPYRYSPYPNRQWATTYSGVKEQLNSANMIPLTRSATCDVPIVFNEMGVCKSYCDSTEYSFWDAILHNAKDLGIGVCAYYWISDADLGPAYAGESLVSGTWEASSQLPTPNTVGQTFLKYAPPSQYLPTPTLSYPNAHAISTPTP